MKQLRLLLNLLPLLIFTLNFKILVYSIVLIIVLMSRMHYLCIDIDYDDLNKVIDYLKEMDLSRLFSDQEGTPLERKFNRDFTDSLVRVRDFIGLVQKDGSYPEDFSYDGYTKDDGSITHSKSPTDWGIDDSFDFGEYKDLTKRKKSSLQMANWLEFDYRVNQRRSVIINSDDNTLNTSGIKWFREYCADNKLRIDNANSVAFRDALRKFAVK